MTRQIGALVAGAFMAAFGAASGGMSVAAADPLGGRRADIVILGEVHDNPAHHAAQAEAVAALAPAAIVFEMLTEDQAARVAPEIRFDAEALGAALEWEASGWPDFAMYHPIFTAAPEATIIGAAVPGEQAWATLDQGLAAAFGPSAPVFGLDTPLPEAERAARVALQAEAHCGAMGAEMLPLMVDIQRLRDAVIARAALRALQQTGGPVAVITGNGHARPDWGVPAYIARVAPDATQLTIGQSEGGQAPAGGFERVIDAPAPEREDPCAAFGED